MARIKSARSAGDWAKARDMLPEQHKIPMGSVDTAWLRMDSAVNRMVIVGVWVLKPGITRKALCERVQATLLKYPRFWQRPKAGPKGMCWEPDANFSLDDHIVCEKLRWSRWMCTARCGSSI